jgi:RNA polymerase sigma-70 factor (ECF subfamily)
VNAAVARAEVDGPGDALADLDAIPAGARGHAWHTVRAELLERLDDLDGAAAELEVAAAAAPAGPERRHLERRRAEVLLEVAEAAEKTPRHPA